MTNRGKLSLEEQMEIVQLLAEANNIGAQYDQDKAIDECPCCKELASKEQEVYLADDLTPYKK